MQAQLKDANKGWESMPVNKEDGRENERVAKETYDMLNELLTINKKPQQANLEHPLNTLKVSDFLQPKKRNSLFASKANAFKHKLYHASTMMNADTLKKMKNRMAGSDKGLKNREIIDIVGEETPDEVEDEEEGTEEGSKKASKKQLPAPA